MALIDQTGDSTKNVCWGRGDSRAQGFVIQDPVGAVVDITGFTFKLTVNTDQDPDPGTELFTVAGVITDGPNGKVAFAPAITDTDQAPGEYFYDVEQTDAGGAVSTVIKGVCEIVQDISK